MAEKQCDLLKNGGGMDITDFMGDTSYRTLPISWLNLTSIKYKKSGNTVTVIVPTQNLKCATANVDYWSTVIIPVGYRPPESMYFPMYSGGYAGISSAGQILFHPLATDTWVQTTMTFVV